MATITPTITVLDDTPLIERLKAVKFPAGQSPTIAWTMVSDYGQPLDLTGITAPAAPAAPVTLAVLETVAFSCGVQTFPGTVTTASTGAVSAVVDGTKLTMPGVYIAEMAVNGPTGSPSVTNRFYLVLERSLFGGSVTTGPPTMAEIRLHLRDSSAAESRLLDAVKFDIAEIAAAIEKPVLYWNETLPPVCKFDTTSFPFRYHWLEGISAQLLFMASEWYRANSLQYSAAGVQVADMEKSQECREDANRRWEAYKAWAKSKKISINMTGFNTSIGSLYGPWSSTLIGY